MLSTCIYQAMGEKKNVLITNSIPKSKGKIQKSNHGPFKKLDEGQVP